MGTVNLPLMSAATVTVTGRGKVYVEYPGHGKSGFAIPRRVTGDVEVPGHRTGTGVNLRHGTGYVAFPGHVIVTGKFPGQINRAAAIREISILTAAVPGTLPVTLRSLGTIPLLFGSLGTEPVSFRTMGRLPEPLCSLCSLP